MIRARFKDIRKARRVGRVSRIKVDVNAKTVEAMNVAMEGAITADLVRGMRVFSQEVLKVEIDRAFNAKDYSELRESKAWTNAQSAVGRAADKLTSLVPNTAEAVRSGIAPDKGNAAGDASFRGAINFDQLFGPGPGAQKPAEAPPKLAVDSMRRKMNADNPETQKLSRERTKKYLTDLVLPDRKEIQSIIRGANTSGRDVTGERDSDTAQSQIYDKLSALVGEKAGLTERQRRGYDNLKASMLKDGPLSKPQKERLRDAADDYRLQRARVIAVTEVRAASATAQLEAWLAMQEEGLISPSAKKQWVLGWEEACPRICRPIDGQLRPLAEDFTLGNGKPCRAAGMAHPNCRCQMLLVDDDIDADTSGRDEGAFAAEGEYDDDDA